MESKNDGAPSETDGLSQEGRKRRRKGGAASGMIARPRLDQKPRKTIGRAPPAKAPLPRDGGLADRVLTQPVGDQGTPLPMAPRGTRPSSPPSIDEEPLLLKRGGKK